MTEFILKNALKAAKKVIDHAEHISLSELDSLHVFATLENPPAPNARLLAAAHALPK